MAMSQPKPKAVAFAGGPAAAAAVAGHVRVNRMTRWFTELHGKARGGKTKWVGEKHGDRRQSPGPFASRKPMCTEALATWVSEIQNRIDFWES
ncbi:hypothetical protein ABZP36_003237 [Zizania latifolia]